MKPAEVSLRYILVAIFAIQALPAWASEAAFVNPIPVIPGSRIEAANYDTGGSGVGYSVSGVYGSGNSYRSDGVDLEQTSDGSAYFMNQPGDNLDLGWIQPGQWFNYTVNVAAPGAYTLYLRLAAPSAVSDGLHIGTSLGSTNASGNINIPATGGAQNWTTVPVTMTLPAGQQVLTIYQDNWGWNMRYMTSEAAYAGMPTIPTDNARIEAANYDTGGQGVGYSVDGVYGSGNGYRPDGVDLEQTSDDPEYLNGQGGDNLDLGWIQPGQRFKYTVDVLSAGTYKLILRLAAPSAVNDALHIGTSLGSSNLSGNVNIPATGGAQNWTNVPVILNLPAGQQTLTVYQDNWGWNMRYMTCVHARACWVWTASTILGNSSATSSLFSFLAAPKGAGYNAITMIACAFQLSQLTDPTAGPEIRSFISTAHQQGISVYFVCGDPTWATTNESVGLATLDSVLAFNQNGAAATNFDGFQYDVEPYTLTGWPSTSMENGWVKLMSDAKTAIAASGQSITFSATIPFWLDSATYNYCDQAIINNVNEVSILDYTTSSSNFDTYPAAEIAYCNSAGKNAWVGAETNDEGSNSVSYYGLGNAAMETTLDGDILYFQRQPSFAGYEIEDYAGYVDLGP